MTLNFPFVVLLSADIVCAVEYFMY